MPKGAERELAVAIHVGGARRIAREQVALHRRRDEERDDAVDPLGSLGREGEGALGVVHPPARAQQCHFGCEDLVERCAELSLERRAVDLPEVEGDARHLRHDVTARQVVEVLQGEAALGDRSQVGAEALVRGAERIGDRGLGERLRAEPHAQVGQSFDHAAREVAARADVSRDAAEGGLARIGRVARGVEHVFPDLGQALHRLERHVWRVVRDARQLVAHPVERDVLGRQGDRVCERRFPARLGLAVEAVHQVHVRAREARGADVLHGPRVVLGSVGVAGEHAQQVRLHDLDAHADAIDAHRAVSAQLVRIGRGDARRRLDGDVGVGREAHALPDRLEEPLDLARRHERRRAAAHVETGDRAAAQIDGVVPERELGEDGIGVGPDGVVARLGAADDRVLAERAARLAERHVHVEAELARAGERARHRLALGRARHPIRSEGDVVRERVRRVRDVVVPEPGVHHRRRIVAQRVGRDRRTPRAQERPRGAPRRVFFFVPRVPFVRGAASASTGRPRASHEQSPPERKPASWMPRARARRAAR